MIADPPLPLTSTQAAAVDDDASIDLYSQWVDGPDGVRLRQSRLLISGMHCAACAGIIESALTEVAGVRGAEVSGSAQRAVVTWNPEQVQPSDLITSIQNAGYGAFPDTGAEAVTLATQESRKAIWRLFVAAFCMMQVMMYAAPFYVGGQDAISPDTARLLNWASWVLTLPVMFFSAGAYFSGAFRSLRDRRISMDVPVALGILVAFLASTIATFQPGGALGHEVYFDSLTMFVAFLLGARVLETRARRRAAQSLDAVMRRLPDTVERFDEKGTATLVPYARLRIGDLIRIQSGQAFAADGRIEQGSTQVDESMLTGESVPVERTVGDRVAAGCLNLGAPVLMTVEALGSGTRYQQIVNLVERALTQRPAFVQSTERMAGPFLWAVLALAIGAALLWQWIDPSRSIWVAVAILVVTCPCALSLGAPVTLLAAAGELARRGILVQRLDALESLDRATHVVLDKTGTLTEDRLTLGHVERLTSRGSVAQVREIAASLAVYSVHPLSRAVAGDAARAPLTHRWFDVSEIPGQGLQGLGPTLKDEPGATVMEAGLWWRLGHPVWAGVEWVQSLDRPAVWLACAERQEGPWTPVARFEFDEVVRPQTREVLDWMGSRSLTVEVLSGDQPGSVAALASRLGLEHARGQCTPQDKLDRVGQIQADRGVVVMVGDGINDAPVLARADVSVAMGSGTALAQARADVIVLSNRIDAIRELIDMSQRTMRIVRQNLRWALAYNLIGVPLAATGVLSPLLAGTGMALSSLLVVLNALRLTRKAQDDPNLPYGDVEPQVYPLTGKP